MFAEDGIGSGPTGNLVLGHRDNPPEDWEGLLAADGTADYFHTAHWTCSARDHHEGMQAFWLTVLFMTAPPGQPASRQCKFWWLWYQNPDEPFLTELCRLLQPAT